MQANIYEKTPSVIKKTRNLLSLQQVDGASLQKKTGPSF